jgi:UDP-N-acetylmuramoyl-tripeptide--D-alanyl-D-alanine ligase
MNTEIAIGYITWLIFFVVSARDILYYLWLFQIKEYRIDRLSSYLKENKINITKTTAAFLPVLIALPFLIFSFPIHIFLICIAITLIKIIGKKDRSLFNVLYFIYVLMLNILLLSFLFELSSQIQSEIFFEETSYDESIYNESLFIIIVSFLYFLVSSIGIMNEIKKRAIKRPRITPKIILTFSVFATILILFATIPALNLGVELLQIIQPTGTILPAIFETLIAAIPLLIDGLQLTQLTQPLNLLKQNTGFAPAILVTLNLTIPLIIFISIIIVTPFSNWQKKKIIKAATEKRKSLKRIRTIGITGSYGKTSTKEFLYAILSSKYKVIKTEGNNNTAMGVASTVLNKVSDDFDFFICEMGAYKIGEIKEICEIAQPEIGIITGINEQHIDLFGSIENTKSAKFELAQSLPQTGFVVINQKALAMPPETPFKAETVAFSKELIKDLAVYPDYITFQYEGVFFRLNALGKHYSENLLAAIMTAEKIGITLEEINEAVLKISLRDRYIIQKVRGPQGAVFIDDSYSANPDGVMAALDYMQDAYGDYKKIFVFPGIIELGKKSEEIHRKIWKKVDVICDITHIIQNKDQKIAKENPHCQFFFEKNFDKVAQALMENLDEKTVVLFESRGAGVVMQRILNKK